MISFILGVLVMAFVMGMWLAGSLDFSIAQSVKKKESNAYEEHSYDYLQFETNLRKVRAFRRMMCSDELIHFLNFRQRQALLLLLHS